ncbi:GNAT family N-acetyltransferase [Nonomuraea sp. NPDC048826]|uniref:GNAT family N-acetyltransferase n=1 Tax=Nonomuraea sp. NPDC048826 TaxID=3364347 RepID=UPI00370FDC52
MLGGLTPEAWDDLAGPRFYSTSAWLRFCAAEYGGKSDAVVRDGAAVPYTELTEPPMLPLYRWTEQLEARGLPAPPPAGLLVGPREGYQTHFLGAPEGVPALVAELRERADGRPCVAMYLPPSELEPLRDAGVTAPPVVMDADAWIAVDDWPGYLSKRKRYRVRAGRRAFEEAGYVISHVPLAECVDLLGVPAAKTLAKYGIDSRPEEELAALRGHADSMGEAARVAVCRRDGGDPVGFCLYYVGTDAIFLRWAGFDYDRLADVDEYGNVVLVSQLDLAAELGLRWVHAGLKSSAAKALYGARLRPVWLVDLTPGSVLDGAADQVRRHNADVYRELRDDPRTAGALDPETWRSIHEDTG